MMGHTTRKVMVALTEWKIRLERGDLELGVRK